MRPPPRALGLPRSRPRGSAYVLTLMAMVVLAVAGLSLAVVTRMERQLGVNERTLQEIFYASESGLALATVRTLALRDRAAFELTLPRRSVGATHVADRLRVSASRPLRAMPCNYCEINQGTGYHNVGYAVRSTAERVIWHGPGAPPATAAVVGRVTVGAMIELQPWRAGADPGPAEGAGPSSGPPAERGAG